MSFTPIPALPAAPSRGMAPDTFISTADIFVAALPGFRSSANQLASDVNGLADAASASAAAAAGSAAAAAGSATTAQGYASTAVNSPGTQATSVTSLAISNGTKNLTLQQTGKAFSVGQWVYLTDQANASVNWMQGSIASFNAATGAMIVSVVRSSGTGTIAAWYVMPGIPTIGGATASTDANNTWTAANTFQTTANFYTNTGADLDAAAGSTHKVLASDGGAAYTSYSRTSGSTYAIGTATDNTFTVSSPTSGAWIAKFATGGVVTAKTGYDSTNGFYSVAGDGGAAKTNGTTSNGLGRTSTDLFSSGGRQVQVAGQYGVRIAGPGVNLDLGSSQAYFSGTVNAPKFVSAGDVEISNTGRLSMPGRNLLLGASGADAWRIINSGTANTGLEFQSGSVYRGAFNTTAAGLFVINDTGGASITMNQGSAYGGALAGSWAVGNGFTVNGNHEVLGGTYLRGSLRTLNGAGNAWVDFLIRNGDGTLNLLTTNATVTDGLQATRLGAGGIVAVAGSVYATGWFRSSGASGWYSQDFTGGVYMQNANFVEVYGGKKFRVPNALDVTVAASPDPFGAIGVTRVSDATNYCYYGLTRQGSAAWGIGIATTNRLAFGTGATGSDSPISSISMTIDDGGNVRCRGRFMGSAVDSNGFGAVTLTTSDAPTGGSQGDFWAVY